MQNERCPRTLVRSSSSVTIRNALLSAKTFDDIFFRKRTEEKIFFSLRTRDCVGELYDDYEFAMDCVRSISNFACINWVHDARVFIQMESKTSTQKGQNVYCAIASTCRVMRIMSRVLISIKCAENTIYFRRISNNELLFSEKWKYLARCHLFIPRKYRSAFLCHTTCGRAVDNFNFFFVPA